MHTRPYTDSLLKSSLLWVLHEIGISVLGEGVQWGQVCGSGRGEQWDQGADGGDWSLDWGQQEKREGKPWITLGR